MGMTITTQPDDMIRMADGAWSLTCPRADLPKWRGIYIRLRDRNKPKTGPGPYHQFYSDDVAAIEAAMKGQF